jgi:arylsulfatase A-like enzyme
LTGGLVATARSAAPPGSPDVLLISIDTLRADRLGCYGYPRKTSPNIDRLSARGYRIEDVTCQATNTNPSHASILSGLDPPRHGNMRNGHRLTPGVMTLAEMLRESGYATSAVIGGVTLKAGLCALDQGFDDYDDRFEGVSRPANDVTDLALSLLSDLPAGKPSFMLVHYYDVHGPYEPPAQYRDFFSSAEPPPGAATRTPLEQMPRYQRFEGQVSARFYLDGYDGEIRFVDAEIGRLMDGLRLARRDERTWVIVLSDHGETLLERLRLFQHGGMLTDEQITIPLILRPPGGLDRPIVLRGPFQSTDVTPVILDITGMRPPAGLTFDGRSFFEDLTSAGWTVTPPQADAPRERFSFAVARCSPWLFPEIPVPLDREGLLFSLRTSRFKLVRFPTTSVPHIELYDLHEDPGEKNNIAPSQLTLVRSLEERLDRWLSVGPGLIERGPSMDDETREMLRSLGYVD